jgi:23S rRNA (guanosine2251-2'-O)-methyltransferase
LEYQKQGRKNTGEKYNGKRQNRSEHREPAEARSDVIAGRNAVMEVLRTDRQIDVIYLLQTATGGSMSRIIALAKEKKIVIKTVTQQKLDSLSGGVNHQGVVAVASVAEYVELEDILKIAEERNEAPFVVICDEIEDPHNLGAIIRTAEAVGVHGVVIPKRRSASLTQVVYKTSAGAASVVPVCRVANLTQAIETLKKEGVWVYSADMDGTPWCQTDYRGGVALVIGSEGRGVSRIVKEQSDFVVSLPMNGQINSLNASVAAGILMYEISRQRLGLQAK